jgi:glutamate formiminotransferase
MSKHEGAHPCVGAIDVCPIVYPTEAEREGAEAIAHEVAESIGDIGIPVFLYGRLAGPEEHRERSFFRDGGFESIVDRIESAELAPDHGPPTAHATAGVCLVTARPPLAAFNIWLGDGQAAQARSIAAELREAGGGLPGVRAIGLDLDGGAQVSMNIHDPVGTPLAEVLERVEELAESHGAEVSHAELVGLIPAAAMEGWPVGVPLDGFDEARSVIEERLAELVV